ncbi:MAG TPA: sigma factor, partial [Jiangellaceae bacterium]|nr:sigma factor [Jiangellaceae bacterium]
MEPSDDELVLVARAGDAGACAALLGRHRAVMHAVAVSVLGASADAEDVVQDACLVALGGLGRLRDPHRVRSWLAGICRNL